MPVSKADPLGLAPILGDGADGVLYTHRLVAIDNPLPDTVVHLHLGHAITQARRCTGSPEIVRFRYMGIGVNNLDAFENFLPF
ncbi:hypothetical protein D3C72_2121410 [compost metagenome]